VLVGLETGDDACVYKLNEEQAVVETLDFFTPVVNDLYDFGRVAAANALGDVYAMGAKPLFALNIVAFPARKHGVEALGRMLAGGSAIAEEAEIPVLGGHSIEDSEPKYGMVVTGLIHPDKVLKNNGGHPGDVLFLTKPLGSGVLTTGIKAERITEEQERRVIEVMTTLNKAGAEAMVEVGVRAATDVTGFGLLGHLREMVKGSGCGARLSFGSLPVMDGVLELIESGVCPGGSKRNLDHFGQWADFADDLDEGQRLLVADAQTSGGLLIACPTDRADALAQAFAARDVPGVVIGEFTTDNPERIAVTA
jgi:selenide, water dikinase